MIIAFPRHRRRRRGTSSALPLIYIFRIYIYTASTSSYTAQLVASSREVNSPLSIACQYGYISRSSRLVVVVAIYTMVCWRQKEGEREDISVTLSPRALTRRLLWFHRFLFFLSGVIFRGRRCQRAQIGRVYKARKSSLFSRLFVFPGVTADVNVPFHSCYTGSSKCCRRRAQHFRSVVFGVPSILWKRRPESSSSSPGRNESIASSSSKQASGCAGKKKKKKRRRSIGRHRSSRAERETGRKMDRSVRVYTKVSRKEKKVEKRVIGHFCLLVRMK